MDTCHQHQRKIDTLAQDLQTYGEQNINLNECSFAATTEYKPEYARFIERYEWLGKMSNYPTNYFSLSHNDIMVCLVIMDMPTTFSKCLGENTRKLERLISRGASISFAPKNTASFTISRAMRWMVQNSPYRLFTAYSDPSAGELGTIYQALNFYYLGNNFGTVKQFNYNGRWVSDRTFRSRSAYKRYATRLGIIWQKEWQTKDIINWENMPQDICQAIRQEAKNEQQSCETRTAKRKHKYAYVLGQNKKETGILRQQFLENNRIKPYPTERGI